MFLAHPEVRNRRRTLSDLEKENAIENKPNYNIVEVYIDESGKTDSHLVLGSAWFYGISDYENTYVFKEYFELTKQYHFSEFHFKEINKQNYNDYLRLIDFIEKCLTLISFRGIILKNEGRLNTLEAIENIFEILIIGGVEDELNKGMFELPREIIVFKDPDDIKKDKILLNKVKLRLNDQSVSKYDNKLITGKFEAIPSENSFQIQIADIFTGAVSRKVNFGNDGNNPKDIVSKYFYEKLLDQTPTGYKSNVFLKEL